MEPIQFIKDCGAFFVLTATEQCPVGRPFGAVMECDGDLYISTSNTKQVYAQIKQNPNVQFLALKHSTRTWMRMTGIADECFDVDTKEKMLRECPILTKHFPTAQTPQFVLFRVCVKNVEFYE